MLEARKSDLSSSLSIMVKQANEASIHTHLNMPEIIDLRQLESVKNYRALLRAELQILFDKAGDEIDAPKFYAGQLLGGIIAFDKVAREIEDNENQAA